MKPNFFDRNILPGGCLVFETKTNSFKSNWHSHNEHELVYINKGQGTLNYGASTISYKADDLFLFGPWMPHEFIETTQDHHSISCIFHSELLSLSSFNCLTSQSISNLLQQSIYGVQFKNLQESHKNFFASFFSDISKINGLQQAIKIILFMNRLIEKNIDISPLSNITTQQEKGFLKKYRQLQNILKYINENMANEITINEITKRFFISRSSLARLFDDILRMNLTQYVNQQRLFYACQLLSTTSLPITDISNIVGFKSISSFNRNFLKYKSLSPRDYRKKSQT